MTNNLDFGAALFSRVFFLDAFKPCSHLRVCDSGLYIPTPDCRMKVRVPSTCGTAPSSRTSSLPKGTDGGDT